jgi:hypothetical protein
VRAPTVNFHRARYVDLVAMLVVRGGGWLLVLAIASTFIVIPLMLASEGESNPLPAVLILVAMSIPLAAYASGLLRWHSRAGHPFRVAGWIGLVLASIPLVSFSFILWPLLLAATPTLLRWSAGNGSAPDAPDHAQTSGR